ncbi:hypothetical protein BU198_25880 [Streptomyces sp. CBMA156]|nr:hypothetical protein [Streptomyces sp. CBMA156]MBD0674051.1 hypothetical protein [Streptomyces sp. CBMA156]
MIAGGPCSTSDDGNGNGCGNGDCPTIYMTDRGTIAVQGYDVDHATPVGESVVEIPEDVLRGAFRALGW